MNHNTVFTQFPDVDYIPLREGSYLYDTIIQYTIEDFEHLLQADCWGLYIRRQNGTIQPLFNAYPYRDGVLPRWLEGFRKELHEFPNRVIPTMKVGETLVCCMFVSEGWAMYATRTEDGWSYEYRQHPEY
jgi:hypothetical protein